LGCKHPCG